MLKYLWKNFTSIKYKHNIKEIKVPVMKELFSHFEENFRFFLYTNGKLSSILKDLKKKFLVYRLRNTYLVTYKNTFIYIAADMTGFIDACEYVRNKYKADKTRMIKALYKMVVLELHRYTEEMMSVKKEIVKEFPGTEINPLGIVLNIDIEPLYYIYGSPAKVKELPDKYKKNIITRVDIKTNPFGDLCSATIDAYHPNANDNGKFCLGKIRFKPLCVENVVKLVKMIKIYNLTNCYSIPDKELVKEL